MGVAGVKDGQQMVSGGSKVQSRRENGNKGPCPKRQIQREVAVMTDALWARHGRLWLLARVAFHLFVPVACC